MRPIWSFDYQKRADPTEITTFFGDFPDPAGSSVRRIGNALILGLERIPVNEAAPDHASHPNLISQPDQALRCGFPFAGLGKWPTTGRCQPTEKIRSDVASMLTRPRYADRFVITGRRFCQTETDPDVVQQTNTDLHRSLLDLRGTRS